ncbi:PTS sugar transporter subunit IIA [Anaerostipes butyraticus]|uniref:PTS sugar transporter subunit IIA n=1 Tax=Anaerostipes butyraticus TaxID=645466 RepID=UPI00320A7D0B
MDTGQLFHENCIILNLEAKDKESAMQALYKTLYQAGKVKESFLKGVMDREKVFPTGLKIGDFGIAIPHTDPEHVKEAGIAIATLKNPVEFECMDNPDTKIEAGIIFMLALENGHNHVEVISQIVKMFQNQAVLEALQKAETNQEVMGIVKSSL